MSKTIAYQTIFIVGPIGEKGSEIRQKADDLRNEIIAPAAVEAFGEESFVLERADDIGQPGRISLQVLEKLVMSDIAIVDLTGLNANVMYELGVRQAKLRPYVLLRPSQQPLPFDIADLRAVEYDFTLPGGKKAIKLLAEMLRNIGKSVTATDELLFGSAQSNNPHEGFQQRIQVQILDQLNSIRETLATVGGGVFHLMQQEERQRADMAEYRQQEMGMRVFEMLAAQSDPQSVISLIQQFANTSQLEPTQPSTPEVNASAMSRPQRRAAAKRKGKQ